MTETEKLLSYSGGTGSLRGWAVQPTGLPIPLRRSGWKIEANQLALIPVTRQISIDQREIRFDFVRASGPGGQKVNKSSSAVQLRFDALGSPGLPEEVRARLKELAGRRLSEEGVLVIEASRFRSQERNRQDALNRLTALIREAAREPRRRRPTRPGSAARERRKLQKKRRSELKRQRRWSDSREEP